VWDAWNRLVEVKDDLGATIVRYAIDAQGWRISEDDGSVVRDFFYSDGWQLLEEHVDGEVAMQYVWSPVYIDAMILRDRDSDGNGTLDERLYVVQDANSNVTALVDVNGDVVERFAYDPYGIARVYNEGWTEKGGSDFAWQYLHQGLRFEEATGLYHNRAREYSPTLMRFVSVDLVGLKTGVSYYSAYNNAPSNYVDSGGLQAAGALAAPAVGGGGGLLSGGALASGGAVVAIAATAYGSYQLGNWLGAKPAEWFWEWWYSAQAAEAARPIYSASARAAQAEQIARAVRRQPRVDVDVDCEPRRVERCPAPGNVTSMLRVFSQIEFMKEMIDPETHGRTTFSVAEVCFERGNRSWLELWVSAAGTTGDVPARLRLGATPVRFPGSNIPHDPSGVNDAERAILREARRVGALILAIRATRAMCPTCQAALRASRLTGFGAALIVN
jgi:RHS repeat-associated protein